MSSLRAQMDRKRMLEYTEATSSRKLPDLTSQGRDHPLDPRSKNVNLSFST